MRKSFLLLFLFSSLYAASFEEAKYEIAQCQQELDKDPKNSGAHFRLALAYHQDQELNRAFKHFLLSLEYMEAKEPLSLEPYKELLELYLTQGGIDPIRTAHEMIKKYEGEEQSTALNFILAMAYANLGEYDAFFSRFYAGYAHLKETFLAYKTQGILYLRLSQHAGGPEERHTYQEDAFRYLSLALERNAHDASLYKILIFLAKDEKNDALVQTYLQKMVANGVALPRSDIYLYVREAVALDEFGIAQSIIDKARQLYEYSRAITAAQEYLNQHRG